MNIQEKAAQAKRLWADEAFQMLLQEVRDDAHRAFATSAAKDTEVREEAHALLRAISKIEGTLRSHLNAKALADKKERHRG